jgi:hypothetical protein
LFLCALNEYDLNCYEDDETNRLQETLELFSETISNLKREIEIQIVFTKKDILIEKIKNGNDFSNLKEFGFNKEKTYKNIVEFHTELFVKIINKNSKKLEKFHFYTVNLVDYIDSVRFYNNVMKQIIHKKNYSIEFLNFHFYDLFFIYIK